MFVIKELKYILFRKRIEIVLKKTHNILTAFVMTCVMILTELSNTFLVEINRKLYTFDHMKRNNAEKY